LQQKLVNYLRLKTKLRTKPCAVVGLSNVCDQTVHKASFYLNWKHSPFSLLHL